MDTGAYIKARTRKARQVAGVFRAWESITGRVIDTARPWLDIGSHQGEVSGMVAGQLGVQRLYGVDLRAESLEASSDEAKSAGMHFIRADATRAPFADGAIGCIICNNVLEHLVDKEALVREARRVLRPGGLLFLAAPNRIFPIDSHYGLIFNGYLPRWMQKWRFKRAKPGREYDLHFYGPLRRATLFRGWKRYPFTHRLIADPDRFAIDNLVRPGSLVTRLPGALLRLLALASPNYVDLYEKENR